MQITFLNMEPRHNRLHVNFRGVRFHQGVIVLRSIDVPEERDDFLLLSNYFGSSVVSRFEL